jgi:hypothetical protein
MTVNKLVRNALPFTAVSVADSIPLSAAGVNSFIIAPISLGARMTVGAIWEGCKRDERPLHRKIGYGMLRGTGIPGAVSFFKKSPEPDINAGQLVKLNLDKEKTEDLFSFNVKPATDADEKNAKKDVPQKNAKENAGAKLSRDTNPAAEEPSTNLGVEETAPMDFEKPVNNVP